MLTSLHSCYHVTTRLIACFIFLGLAGNRLNAYTTVPGDLNNDFDATVADIAILVSHIQGFKFLEPEAVPYVDFDQNGTLNNVDVEALAAIVMESQGPQEIPMAAIKETLPQRGESNVGVKRETILYFTLPLAEDTIISNDNFFALFGGEKLLTRIEVSSDRLKATLFYTDPLPDNSRVRVIFDGAGIKDILGRDFDPDRNGTPGGLFGLDFNTVSITELPGTAISGSVFKSRKNELDQDVPLAGVIIEVVGAEETIRTTTAGDGSFTLNPCPAGRFFVNVDGRPVTGNFPTGDYYPFVGKAWYTKPGRMDNLVNDDGKIYLPLIMAGSLKTVSQTEITVVEFPQAVLDENPALNGVRVTVLPNSLFNEEGTRGGMMGIAPVAPDRIPEPLPAGLNLPLVITVQTDGPANFDRPAPVVFPNLPNPETGDILPPGSKSALWSFNHDTGVWEIGGPMTVSADGLTVSSDPGVGIRQPGWHGTWPGTSNSGGGAGPGGGGGPDGPDGCQDPNGCEDDETDCKTQAALAISGVAQAGINTALAIPKSIPAGAGFGISTGINAAGAAVDSYIAPNRSGEFMKAAAFNTALSLPTAIANPPSPDPASRLFGLALTLPGIVDGWVGALDRIADLLGCGSSGGSPSSFINPNRGDVLAKMADPDALRIILEILQAEQYPFASKSGTYWGIQADLLKAFLDFNIVFFGAETWVYSDTGPFKQFIFQKLVDDFFIGETEKNLILNSVLKPVPVTVQEVNALIDLLNERYSNGISETDRLAFLDAAQRIKTGLEAIRDQTPYDQPYFFWNDYLPQLWRELFPPPPDPPLIIARSSGPGGGSGGGGGGGPVAYTAINTPIPGEHYFKLVNMNNRAESRGRTNKLGQLDNLILSPDSAFYLTYYKPDSNEIALSIFRTPPAGVTNRIPVSHFFEVDVSEVDSDGDHIPDIAEDIVGTDPNDADSDGDGVLDGAELVQDGNPLDNQPAAVGLLGNLPSSTYLVDLATKNDLLFAASTNGDSIMTVYDISSSLDPVRIGQFALEGVFTAVQIAVQGEIAALALGQEGVLLLDISDPAAPVEFKRVKFRDSRVTAIAMDGNYIFAGLSDGRIVTIDVLTGLAFSEVQIELNSPAGFGDLTDLTLSSKYLYAKTGGYIYTLKRVAGAFLEEVSALSYNGEEVGKLFLGNGILLSTQNSGYLALDLSDPSMPTLVNSFNLGSVGGWKEMVLNGSGLMLAAASPASSIPRNLDIYDVGTTGFGSTFRQTITTPNTAESVILNNGIAYVGGRLSLSVVNYLASDNGTTPPTISVSSDSGNSLNEGSSFTLSAQAVDDVQVRNVEFYLNNVLITKDGNYPFNARIQAPLLANGSNTLTIHAIANDTAGNRTQSEPLIITITEDTGSPIILGSLPLDQSFNSQLDRIGIIPSEVIDPPSVNGNNFYLIFSGPDYKLGTLDDSIVTGGAIVTSNTSTLIYLKFPNLLEPGIYRIHATNNITDLKGNPLSENYSSMFSVFGINDADSDGDGIPDEIEDTLGYNPLLVDSDGNGIPDGDEDFDQDGLTNIQEIILGTDLNDTDSDNDGLSDFEEVNLGTNPTLKDTDGDGLDDKREVTEGLDPLDPDTDGDLLDDGTEDYRGFAPKVANVLEHSISAPVVIFYKEGSSAPEDVGAVSKPVAQENQ